jgi:type VI secretion system secreted protein Hcp
MADIFLKIDQLDGESGDDKHKNEIEVISFTWGAKNVGVAGVGQQKTAGKVDVADLFIRKYTDKASPTLMLCCCNGKRIKSATLTVRRPAADSPLDYVTIALSDCTISQHTFDGMDENHLLTETVGLNFGKWEYKYTLQGPDGKGAGDVKTNWDNVAAKSS